MKIFTQRLDNYAEQALGNEPTLALPFEIRQKSRFRATLIHQSAMNEEDIGVDLPRTGVLRDGCFIGSETGDVLKITAKPEALMKVTAKTPFDLLKASYHLGNRHVVLMVTPDALYFEPDHVLAEMVENLGLIVETGEFPFEPESGAYQQHHHDTRFRPVGH